MIPWTKMPAHWDKKGDEYLVKTKFEKLETVGNVDQQIDAVKDFIIAYNSADVDFDLVLGEDSEEDDAEADSEDSAEDEEEEY